MNYTCTCCGSCWKLDDDCLFGVICVTCGWEWDEWEQSDRPDPIGPNGMHVSAYRARWEASDHAM